MKRRLIAMAALLTLAAGLPAAALAEPGERGRREGDFLERMTERLELSEEQQTRIREIRREERSPDETLRERLEENREAMHALVTSFPFDERAVRRLADEQAELRSDQIVSRARTMNRTLAVLTPEQREEALELLESRKKRGHGNPDGRGPGR